MTRGGPPDRGHREEGDGASTSPLTGEEEHLFLYGEINANGSREKGGDEKPNSSLERSKETLISETALKKGTCYKEKKSVLPTDSLVPSTYPIQDP